MTTSSAPPISPLRISTEIESALAATDTIVITLGSSDYSAGTLLVCTLRDETSFNSPYLTKCSYDSGAKAYTLEALDAIPIGRYLIEVTNLHQDMATEGVTFPTDTSRVTVQVTVASVSEDLDFLAPYACKLIHYIFFDNY